MPSGSSSISDGDDLLRQHWASLESTLATDHRFGSSETLAGYHKPGTARVYTGLSSALSATNLPTDVEEGRVFAELDTGKLYLLGASAQTCFSPGVGAFNVKDTLQSLVFGDNQATFDAQYADVTPNDSDTWITISGATLTVPSGASGYYLLQADVFKPYGFSSSFSDAAYVQINILKNGLTQSGFAPAVVRSLTTQEHIYQSGIVPLKSGDSISLRMSNYTTATITTVTAWLHGTKVG